MTELEAAQEARRRQAMRVANATRGKREQELAVYELLDARVDAIYWAEQAKQQCLRLEPIG